MSVAGLPLRLPYAWRGISIPTQSFWLNLQNFYDLEVSRRSGKATEIEHQVTPAPSLTC